LTVVFCVIYYPKGSPVIDEDDDEGTDKDKRNPPDRIFKKLALELGKGKALFRGIYKYQG
jgi:hypothetical protein